MKCKEKFSFPSPSNWSMWLLMPSLNQARIYCILMTINSNKDINLCGFSWKGPTYPFHTRFAPYNLVQISHIIWVAQNISALSIGLKRSQNANAFRFLEKSNKNHFWRGKKPTFFKPKIISTNKSSNTILDTIKESQAQTEIM